MYDTDIVARNADDVDYALGIDHRSIFNKRVGFNMIYDFIGDVQKQYLAVSWPQELFRENHGI